MCPFCFRSCTCSSFSHHCYAVLPQKLKDRLVSELDKRLDLDLDEFLTSPKLRLKLSPAELDKALLEFYDRTSESPGGDLLRLIGGGGQVGLQNLYIRRQAERERWEKMKQGIPPELFPSFSDFDGADEKGGSASQLVRRSLQRNLSKLGNQNILRSQTRNEESSSRKNKTTPRMSCANFDATNFGLSTWSGLRPPQTLLHRKMPPRTASTNKFSILI